MPEAIKEACKKQACDIQSCLSRNNFNSKRCLDVIQKLERCCDSCKYESTHCASLSDLLNQIKPKTKKT